MLHWVVVRSYHDIWSCSVVLFHSSLAHFSLSEYTLSAALPSLCGVLMREGGALITFPSRTQTSNNRNSSLVFDCFPSSPSPACLPSFLVLCPPPLSSIPLLSLLLFLDRSKSNGRIKDLSLPYRARENMTIRLCRWKRRGRMKLMFETPHWTCCCWSSHSWTSFTLILAQAVHHLHRLWDSNSSSFFPEQTIHSQSGLPVYSLRAINQARQPFSSFLVASNCTPSVEEPVTGSAKWPSFSFNLRLKLGNSYKGKQRGREKKEELV